MKNPLLSIVLIAVKDPSLTFKRALESVLKQTYKEKEVLVVNGNEPSDPYSQSLTEDLTSYAGVRLLQPERVGSEAFYRNLALGQARGQYIAFASGKDEWFPDKASLQVEQLEANRDAAASCANGIVTYLRPKRITEAELLSKTNPDPEQLLMERLVRKASQVVYRTDLLRLEGGFDGELKALIDLDRLLGLWSRHRILFTTKALFTVGEESDRASLLCCLGDRRALMNKHRDIFLTKPKLAFAYCTLMGKHALSRGLLYYAIPCYLSGLFYAPLRFTVRFVRVMLHGMQYWLRRIGLQGLALFLERRLGWLKQKRDYETPSWGSSDFDKPTRLEPGITAEVFVEFKPFYFAKKKGLRTAVIPERVKLIKKGMFFACPDLERVIIPATVSSIEAYAFQGCTRLKDVRFLSGSSLATIGAYAFAGCKSLEGLKLPSSLGLLSRGVFAGCERLERLSFDSRSFPNVIQALPPYVFAGCHALTEAVFEQGSMLRHIGKGAFLNCRALETLTLTGEVKKIGPFAFFGCESLRGFEMPLLDAVGFIGRSAFAGCSSLQEIQVPHALKQINWRTYHGCREVKKVIIPKGVRSIGRQAFAMCTSLLEVTLMNELTYYPQSAFPDKAAVVINKLKQAKTGYN